MEEGRGGAGGGERRGSRRGGAGQEEGRGGEGQEEREEFKHYVHFTTTTGKQGSLCAMCCGE